MAEWRIERLDRSHDRASFSCGKPLLDRFLHQLVGQYETRNLGRTRVACVPGDPRVLGYYTLSSSLISVTAIPSTSAKKLPKHPVPAVLLGRLAVDGESQGRGLGESLLLDTLDRCLSVSDQIGFHAVEVAAIDEPAKSFYSRYGFTSLNDELHLWLPIGDIQKATQVPKS